MGKIIPTDKLMEMPTSFVHRLRDLRIKQLDEADKAAKNNNVNPGNIPIPPGTTYDEIMDELT